MFKIIRKVLDEHKAQQSAIVQREGYEFAAGRLLSKGDCAVKILRDCVDSSRVSDSYTEFEKGIEEAVEDFLKLRNLDK